MDDPGFWWEFVGKVGAPIFSGSLVVSLVTGEIGLLNAALLGAGFGMMAVCHWRSHHRHAGPTTP